MIFESALISALICSLGCVQSFLLLNEASIHRQRMMDFSSLELLYYDFFVEISDGVIICSN